MEHQLLAKEPMSDTSTNLLPHDGHHMQSNAENGAQIQSVLDWLEHNQVTVSQPTEVRNYLTRYSDLAGFVLPVCKAARTRFKNRAKLYLEVNRDPEIDDDYLALYIRQKTYQNDVLKIIREISREMLYEGLTTNKGWFTITTDFKPEA